MSLDPIRDIRALLSVGVRVSMSTLHVRDQMIVLTAMIHQLVLKSCDESSQELTQDTDTTRPQAIHEPADRGECLQKRPGLPSPQG